VSTTLDKTQASAGSAEPSSHKNTVFLVDAAGNITPAKQPAYAGHRCQVDTHGSGYTGPLFIVYQGTTIPISLGTGPLDGWLLPSGNYSATVTANKVGGSTGELEVGTS
jgi:hypothetical protein